MLVDLARNDVGRVVELRHRGGRRDDGGRALQPHHAPDLPGVGRLAPGDGVRSTSCGRHLPAGTLSGAPKVRAMQIIDELEPTKRGVYGGVVGYLDFSGNLDTAIAIRTMTVNPDGSAIGAGRRGHRGRQRPGRRERRMRAQGGRPAVGGGHGPERAWGRGRRSGRGRREAGAAEGRRRSRRAGRGRCCGNRGGSRMSAAELLDDQTREGYAALRRTAAVHQLPRDVLSVSGPDATSYLQGQCSQDVCGPAGGAAPTEALLLSPQGKIDAYRPVDPDGRRHLRDRHRRRVRTGGAGPAGAVPAPDEGGDRAAGLDLRVRTGPRGPPPV